MNEDRKIQIVILAAGKGKRMQSDLPKVLATIKGRSMISRVLSSILEVSGEKPIMIVGHKAELVQSELGNLCFYVSQKNNSAQVMPSLALKKIVKNLTMLLFYPVTNLL